MNRAEQTGRVEYKGLEFEVVNEEFSYCLPLKYKKQYLSKG